MKKFGIVILAALVSVGLVVAMGGCGGSSSGDGTPQSSSAYAGSNKPAVIDSNSVFDYDQLLNNIGEMMDMLSQPPLEFFASETHTESGEYNIDGTGSGTYRETWEETVTMSDTGGSFDGFWEGNFNNFVDSGDQYPYALEGEGGFYQSQSGTGMEIRSATAAGKLALPANSSNSNYVNYSGLEVRSVYDPEYLYNLDGYLSDEFDMNLDSGLCSGSIAADVSYSEVTSVEGAYYGLLDTDASVAYDGSDSTVTGSGTFCGEGNAELSFTGCVDFTINAVWENTNFCDEGPGGYPDSGTYTVSTIDANAMYDFGATSDPFCFKYLLDADNNNSYEYSVIECD